MGNVGLIVSGIRRELAGGWNYIQSDYLRGHVYMTVATWWHFGGQDLQSKTQRRVEVDADDVCLNVVAEVGWEKFDGVVTLWFDVSARYRCT